MHVWVSCIISIFSKEVSEGNKGIIKVESSIAVVKSLGSEVRTEFEVLTS